MIAAKNFLTLLLAAVGGKIDWGFFVCLVGCCCFFFFLQKFKDCKYKAMGVRRELMETVNLETYTRITNIFFFYETQGTKQLANIWYI